MFLIIILGATDERAPAGFAPIAIGLGLTLIHLIGIPVTNLSVNPARSTGPALFVGGWALAQLWLFWVAPIAGAVLGALVLRVAGATGPLTGSNRGCGRRRWDRFIRDRRYRPLLRAGARSESTPRSVASATGFVRCRSKPASSARARSSSRP